MSATDSLGSGKKERRFVAAWMNEFPCIEKVPDNNNKFLCTVCKQEFAVVSKQRLLSHINSTRHQKKKNNEFKEKIREESSHKFLPRWLEDVRFKSWIQTVPTDEGKFRCTLCHVDRSCTAGVGNLIRHAKTPEHIQISIKSGVKTLQDIPNEVVYDSIKSFEDRRKEREIQLASLACTANIPFQTIPKLLKFFQDTDPTILKHMTASATKISNIVRNVSDKN